MEVVYHKKFKKQFKKLPKKIQDKFFERVKRFQVDPFYHSLNNHGLSGEFESVRSFDVTGDIRVHYVVEDRIAILLKIGSHSELYQ